MGSAWPHDSDSTSYNQARLAKSEWWKDLKVDKLYISSGENELLVDGIETWAETLKLALGEKVTMKIIKNEAHDSCNVDPAFGYDDTETGKVIKGWFKSML